MFDFRRVWKILIVFLTIVLVSFFSSSALYVCTPFALSVMISFVASLLFFAQIIANKLSVKIEKSIMFLFFSTIILLNTIVYLENRTFNIYIVSLLVIAFGITSKYSKRNILRVFKWSLFIIALSSILGTLLLNHTDVLDNLPELTSINGWKYKIGFIYNYLPVISTRVIGFFWEPGILASYLSLGLVICFSENKARMAKMDIVYILVVTTAILISTSSAGYVLLVLCISLWIVRGRNGRTTPFQAIRGLLLLGGLIFFLINFEDILIKNGLLDNEYFSKLVFQNVLNSSRFIAWEHNLNGWMKNPLFGMGLSEAQSSSYQYFDLSTSSYLMTIFGFGGALYTFFFIKGIVKLKRLNAYMKIIIILIMLLIINKEPHHYNLSSWIILFLLQDSNETKKMECLKHCEN